MEPVEETQVFAKCANWIRSADFLLITAGAGMGVDSGLKVYNDVAAVRQYRQKKLDYSALSTPKLLASNPALFFGCWGMCWKDYTQTEPHMGYTLLHNWCDEYFPKKNDTQPFFVYTSNVDGHFIKSGFDPILIYHIHGSSMRWQCKAPRRCGKETWALENNFDFDLDENLCAKNLPKCRFCERHARPNVMMFFDDDYFEYGNENENWLKWISQLKENDNVLIIEIGVGTMIPTVKASNEALLAKYPNARLIRINPENITTKCPEQTITIRSGGLEGLTKINEQLKMGEK